MTLGRQNICGVQSFVDHAALQQKTDLCRSDKRLGRGKITVDYFNIEIENAIQAVTAQDIVDSCYDAPSLNNVFCGQFTRNRNASPTFLGFNSITTTQLNFAGLEASGIDFHVTYAFDFADLGQPAWGDVGLSVGGSHVEDRSDYPFANNPTQANPVKL